MSFSLYLKDRLPTLLIFLAGFMIMLCFFGGYHAGAEQVTVISCTYWLTMLIALTADFFTRRGFYRKAKDSVDGLDKKYLLPEMISEPSFYEGRICYELICDAGKSMTENVSEHRRRADEFREFIELWVHEVKLPIASLSLMAHNDGEAGEKYTEQLLRIDTYVENVLYYARSENAQKDYIIKETLLSGVFKEAALKNRESLQQKNISLNAHGLDKKVMTDSKWLVYILTQLIANSLKYLSPDREPVIDVYAEEDENTVTLHFKDNGIGIPATDLPYIFEKSFTGENGRLHSKSTGMGLYIVGSLCRKLGHRIGADSVQGEYTDIRIAFGRNDILRPENEAAADNDERTGSLTNGRV